MCHACVYVCACVYICVYICMCMYVYVCIYVCPGESGGIRGNEKMSYDNLYHYLLIYEICV